MKRFLILITITLTFTFSTRAQYVTIPDVNFRDFLVGNYPSCFNASQMMDTTCSLIVNEASLSPYLSVSNWDGLQYFDNLQELILFSGGGMPSSLPATLKKLVCPGAYTLPPLPNGLLYLDINRAGLSVWPALPNSLQHLDISGAILLPSPTSLPPSLKFLSCYDNYQFGILPALPSTLDTLVCFGNSLSALPPLPATMKVLNCSNNNLSTLPALPSGLKFLDCRENNITGFPTLPGSLENINASYNQVTSLPALPTSLTTLALDNNNITSMPALPAALQFLIIFDNPIGILPTIPLGMKRLICYSCQLSSLPALPEGLEVLDCEGNQITVLPTLPQSLTSLSCGGNQISVLPTLPPSLNSLECSQNLLTSIPSLPPGLTALICSGNPITSLPPLPAHLQGLLCSNTLISYLPELPQGSMVNLNIQNNPNLTCLPVLPEPGGSFLEIYMDSTINCIPNAPNSVLLNVYGNSYPPFQEWASEYSLCSAVNNVHHCAAFPLMAGYAYYDNNNNNVKDANEPYRAHVRVDLSNGTFTVTNSNGYYQVAADSIGAYSVSVTAPPYFAASPAQYNYNFNSYDTLVTNNFAFHATTTVDSVHISIITVNNAKPGFSYPCQVSYSNEGTTTLNANVVFNYDNTRLIYDSCSNASVINTGSSLSLSEPGFVPGIQKSFVGYFRVNPTAVIGDSLRSGAHITTGSTAAHDSDVVAIKGAYDPNDKSATPKLTPDQVINGDYIYYTIRFQNTGTDTAFSIVVTDTLDARLQPSTLQMIATSHPCITTVKGNTISFEFINILLPDSNVNQLKSHGYISFRIKPLNTLIVNDIIPNKAAIYFDYNSPVITNMATTTVVDPIVVPLKLLSFTVSRGVGQNANLYWQTNNEVNVQHYTVEMSTNGRTFTAVGVENAKGYQYNSYTKTITIPVNAVLYFRLKMVDVDGRYNYSNVAILKNDKGNSSFSFLNNPVKDELSISLQDESLRNTTATIFNAQGIKVRTVLLQHDVENINIKTLPAGTYYLVTEKGSGQFVVVK